MEAVVNSSVLNELSLQACYSGQRVFLTGHTGFKGSWLALWLAHLGAEVHGYSLPASTNPSLWSLAKVSDVLATQYLDDVRDNQSLTKAISATRPRIIFHLAAQALVRSSYRDPVESWGTNVMGTVNILEAARHCSDVQAVVVITTDKCYENREWLWGYRENDPLGGHDPYSASKAGAELVIQSFRRSFFTDEGPLLASARAGNVIGGGDWSEDRLFPDAVRATSSGKILPIRSPKATRPWQHVLESLNGYLLLGARLLGGDRSVADAFNFGPESSDNRSVAEVMTVLQLEWPELRWEAVAESGAPHEAGFLYLDSSKAQRVLGWKPRWRLERAIQETAVWYRKVLAHPSCARDICEQQIRAFGSNL